jgi:hypothetical protein
VPRFVHEKVVSLEIVIEEERGQTVKKIDLQALGCGKAISFAVQVQTERSSSMTEGQTPEVAPLTCRGCFHSVTACICEGTKFA